MPEEQKVGSRTTVTATSLEAEMGKRAGIDVEHVHVEQPQTVDGSPS